MSGDGYMNDKLKTELEMLREKLGDTDLKAINVLIGFDGFVDEVLHVVKKRYDMARYDRYEYLHDYGSDQSFGREASCYGAEGSGDLPCHWIFTGASTNFLFPAVWDCFRGWLHPWFSLCYSVCPCV